MPTVFPQNVVLEAINSAQVSNTFFIVPIHFVDTILFKFAWSGFVHLGRSFELRAIQSVK